MPIIIYLKEPALNLVLDGDIKDEAAEHYDEIFPNLMVKDQEGHNIVIPLARDCNIAFIKEVTQEDIDSQRKQAEQRRMAQEKGGPGTSIIKPQFTFPAGKGGRG